MTDSMKFGPEWLRNMSNDMSTSGGSSNSNNNNNNNNNSSSSIINSSTTNSTTAPLGPRYQLAEYRYGREEMLSLFDKNVKNPEVLPTFKTLYVDKLQCPLALTPSTEDDVINSSTRPWGLRSPVSFTAPTRGTGRGGSVDRGRGRTRASFHTLIGYQRPTALYDEDIRGLGKGERGWPERNGGNEIGGTADWNGSPSSSPRKEYNSHGRGNLENWRRSRTEDDAGDGWRGVTTSSSSNNYRWSRSTSWRDEDSSAVAGGGGDQMVSQISRSFSTSSASALDRTNSGSNSSGVAFKSNSQLNQNDNLSNKSGSNIQWEHDDMLPEWATENPTDSGGSFDASGAFHGSNEGNDDDDNNGKRNEKEMNNKKKCDVENGTKIDEAEEEDIKTDVDKKATKIEEIEQKKSGTSEDEIPKLIETNTDKILTTKQTEENSPEHRIESNISKVSGTDQPNQKLQQIQHNSGSNSISSKPPPPPISEISDRMQEVADDMVEKLIMDDELTTTTTKKISPSSSSSVSMLKASSVNSNSSTAPSLMQQPLINSHPMLPQPQPPPSNELWYYRDPQGKVQGPFNAAEMAEWYRAGYFDENLFVRRVCDSRFAALGELVKMCGNSMPFLSSHLIPPLVDMPVPHIAQSNQPTPQQQVAMNTKPSINPMMGTNDVMSLNLQLQFLQKQFLMRQQSMILNKLAASEPWSLLNPEQQQQLLNQQMSQVVLPDHLMSLSALSSSLTVMNSSTFALQQMLANTKNEINHTKPSQSLHNPLGAFTNEFGGLHGLMQSNVAPPPNIGHINQHPGGPGLEVDPIKSLLMQLHMQNKMPAGPAPAPPIPNKWPTNIAPQQSWPGGSSTSSAAPVSMWDFGPISQTKPEMKTEQQILEEQLQKEKFTRQAEIAINSIERPEVLHESVLQQQHVIHQTNQHSTTQSLPPSLPLQQPQQQQQKQQPQQQPITTHQSANKRETEKSKVVPDEKVQKNAKPDDEQKKIKAKIDKKEIKKVMSEEERKKEAAEEKKRQKEEKKRQQMEEEKKRQQQIEEEERRQLLEEKKRQEEIDQHRRAKMLENSGPKPVKKNFERAMSSSVAPWINTGLPGISTPGPNFAEIQKAERERRAEEQRLEQLMEHQRKAQMELLAQKDNVLKWNAHSLKSVNVKSLAEIQAEEAKRLVSEQAAAASLEQRKKEEAATAAQSSSYGNNAFGSIWNSRSSQNIAWNGKTAWGTTSSSGFWEEPTKIPSTPMTSSSVKSQSTNSRTLSKSQTMSSIQSVKKENSKPIVQNNLNKQAKGKNKKDLSSSGQSGGITAKKDDARNEFTSWCIKTLSSMSSSVDVPTFISFLQDIESPFEVKDYIRMYLGETKECTEFAKQFLERRSKYKNQQRAQNAHIDDMCSPAPAINPSSNDFQEIKGKGKKVKKNKMTKLDARILGFSVTAAQDRINVGDRDYGDAS